MSTDIQQLKVWENSEKFTLEKKLSEIFTT